MQIQDLPLNPELYLKWIIGIGDNRMDKNDAIKGIKEYCLKVLTQNLTVNRTDLQIVLDYIDSIENPVYINNIDLRITIAKSEIRKLNQVIAELKSDVDNLIND